MPSDPSSQGPITAILTPIVEHFARHAALPPYEKAIARAEYGAFLLGVCGYAGLTVGPYLPGSWRLGLIAIAGFGLLLVAVGLRGARGPRDVMTIFWLLAFVAGGWWVVVHRLPGLWTNFFGRGFCIGLLCGAAVRFYIALRGLGGDAYGLVADDIDQQEWKW